RYVIAGGRDSGGRTSWRFRRFSNIVQSLIRRIAAHINQVAVADRRADPGEFCPVELYFFATGELGVIERRGEHSQRETIWLGDRVNLIGGDHGARARRVNHKDVGVSRDMLDQVSSDGSGPDIVGVPRQVAHYDPY